MNERIKELSAIAKNLTTDDAIHLSRIHNRTLSLDELGEIFEQKFAELIVRECAFVGRGIGGINVSDAIMKRFGIPEARGWLCPSCGVDRGKEACPKGHHAALTGHCPMVGVAQ